MFARLLRLIRSIFGSLISFGEDPELILQQCIWDMRDKIPQMNNSVAQVMANEKLLAHQEEAAQQKIIDLDSKVKATIKMGRDDLASQFIAELQSAQRGLEITKAQHLQAKAASDQALKFRDNYQAQMKKKTDEAMQLIAINKQAAMQEQLAQTMASFEIGDTAATFDDMREKIGRRAAEAEAKAELATNNLDTKMADVEAEVYASQTQDALLAYKRQMGLLPDTQVIDEGSAAAPHRELVPESEESRRSGDKQRELVH